MSAGDPKRSPSERDERALVRAALSSTAEAAPPSAPLRRAEGLRASFGGGVSAGGAVLDMWK